MITRYRVSLNHESLDALAQEIMILDVAYTSTVYALQATALAARHGQLVHSRTIPTAGVSVTFEIHTQNIARRQEVCEMVRRWAMRGGEMRVNSRPHEYLRVVCDTPPVIPSDLKWTGKITIVFTAYECVFWEQDEAWSVSVPAGESGTMIVPGSAEETPVSVKVVNGSGQTVNSLTVTAGDTVFSFADLALADGETLDIGYDEHGFLYIRAGSASKMDERTPESSDELTIRQRESAALSVTADAEVTATFTARGRSL